MAINYSKVNWDTTKYVNPTNMNQMDEGIKQACDGVDNSMRITNGKSTYVTAGSNLNTVTNTGFYSVPQTCTNKPIDTWGYMTVIAWQMDGAECVQTFIDSNRNEYRRILTGGTWSQWEQMVISRVNNTAISGNWATVFDGNRVSVAFDHYQNRVYVSKLEGAYKRINLGWELLYNEYDWTGSTDYRTITVPNLDNYEEILIVQGYYGNTSRTLLEPRSLFTTHNGTGNRIQIDSNVNIYCTSDHTKIMLQSTLQHGSVKIYGR